MIVNLVTTLFSIGVVLSRSYLITEQINLIGIFASIIETLKSALIYFMLAWACWVGSQLVAEWIIATPKIPDEHLDGSLVRLAARLCGGTAIVFLALIGAQQLGIPAMGLFAGLGVGGIAVALAAQSSIENLIGGLTLYVDRPVRVGDVCHYDTITGTIDHIGVRSTRIRSTDRTMITVPNADLAKARIVNLTMRDQSLFLHTLDLRYDTTSDQLGSILTELRTLLALHPMVACDVSQPRVHLLGLGDWSIKIEMHAYVKAGTIPEYLPIQEELLLRALAIVRGAGSDLAFPTQSIQMDMPECQPTILAPEQIFLDRRKSGQHR